MSRTPTWTFLGLGAALLLHAVAGWGSADGWAQTTNQTITTSTTSSMGFESPPACTTPGDTREEETVTLEDVIGPNCTIIGNRDIANPAAVCPGHPYTGFGDYFYVEAGTTNLNVNTDTKTIRCVAPVPAMPLPWMLGLVLGTIGLVVLMRWRHSGRVDRHV